MDLYKKANINEYTANDLNAKCVLIRYKDRSKMKKIFSRTARSRLKQSMIKDVSHE